MDHRQSTFLFNEGAFPVHEFAIDYIWASLGSCSAARQPWLFPFSRSRCWAASIVRGLKSSDLETRT